MRLNRYATWLTLASGILVLSFHASASPPKHCSDRETIVNHLESKYQERPKAIGVTLNHVLIEVFTSPKGSTWTIIFTDTQGQSCLVATGDNWRDIEQVIDELT